MSKSAWTEKDQIDNFLKEKRLMRSLEKVVATLANSNLPSDPLMTDLEDTTDLLNTGIFSGAYDDEDVGVKADLNNLETTMNVSPIPTTRIHNYNIARTYEAY
ncbi:hypothetical protein Tco_0000506 [Tanacetum coccineum]